MTPNVPQEEVLLIASITFLISVILAYLSLRKYSVKRNEMWLWYSLAFVSNLIATGIQEVWALGYSDVITSAIYMFLVAELVLFFSFGSATQLPQRWFRAYKYYGLAASIVLILGIVAEPADIVENYMPMNYPMPAVGASMVVTIPSTGLILFLAGRALLFKGSNKYKLISIVLGVVVLSAGGMFAASGFWWALYSSEVVGMALLLAGIY